MKKFISIIILVLIPLFVYGQWVQSGGPFGFIYSIALKQSGKDVFVGCAGVFRSTDYGIHWTPLNEGLPHQHEQAICFAFKDDNIFLGTLGDGLFRSTDYGLHWSQTSLDDEDISSIAIYGDTMFAGTLDSGIFRSTDSGNNWSVANSGLTNTNVNALTIDGTALFAGTWGGGAFRSSDFGMSWVDVNIGLTDTVVLSFAILDSTLLAATRTGVFRSSDHGSTWNTTELDSIWVSVLASSDTTIYAATDRGLFRSINASANWNNIDSLMSLNYKSLAANGDYIWIGTTMGGLYRSTNKGISWDATNLLYMNVNTLVASGQTAYAGTIGHVSISSDYGDSWITPLFSGFPEYGWINAFAIKGNKLFAGVINSVYRSTDQGLSWRSVGTGLQPAVVRVLTTVGNNLFAGTDAGIFLSTDDGDTWIKLNTGIPANDMVISFTECNSVLFAGTFWHGVFKLMPNDTIWRSVNTGLTNGRIMALASFGSYVFAGTDGAGMFRMDASDSVWTGINSGIAGVLVNCLASDGTNLFAGTSNSAINFSSDNGELWKSINEGISGPTYISNLAICGPYLLAGTDASLYRRPLSEIITYVSESRGELPTKYFISQNYPNPFNPSTTICYQIPMQSHVTLKVFDVLGREVATLVNRVEEPGYKTINFNANRLASSVYYYRIQAGNYIETKKLLLIR